MAASLEDMISSLQGFLDGHPEIKYIPRTSPEFSSVSSMFNRRFTAVPLAVVRPQTAEHVAALVSYCTANAVTFTIRVGGNNIYGLSKEQDVLMIDLRDINYTKIDESRTSVSFGGGILQSKVIKDLSEQGLVTPTGSIQFLGFVGWTSYGGYGPLTHKYGLGLDNIIGAKMVNAKGEIVTVDRELLKGIRGAGGAFGVIVELTVRVYPLTKILSGLVVFEASDFPSAYENFNAGYSALQNEGIPPELDVQQFVLNSPLGKAISAGIVWSSDDHETGQLWIAKILALGKVIMNTIAPTTMVQYAEAMAAQLDSSSFGSVQTLSVRRWTKETTQIIGRYLDIMPTSIGTGFIMHEIRGPSAAPNTGSVFRSREPHLMLELISMVSKEEDTEESEEWATRLKTELLQKDPVNVLPGTYISVTRPGDAPTSEMYGPNYQTLLGLKKKYDPQNVFSLAVPRLP